MNIEDDDFPDPDYGIWGDADNPVQPRLHTAKELAEMARWRRKREREQQVSRDFNLYLIDLYNEKARK